MRSFVFIAAAVAALSLSACSQLNREEVQFTVESKDRVCESAGEGTSCYYEVYGTDGEVFTNKDDLINGKFDSATMQARFKPGKTYVVKTTGWRVPFLSMKPNIYEAKEVTQ